MGWILYRLLAVLVLATFSLVLSAPQQLPMRLPFTAESSEPLFSPGACLDSGFSPSSVFQGQDLRSVLLDLANSLDQGLPANWERLVKAPNTYGNSASELMHAQDLDQVIANWGIDESMRNAVFDDILALLQATIAEGYYAAQHFTYATPECNPVAKSACMSSLFIVTRPRAAMGDGEATMELSHIYVRSASETLDQMVPEECCHRCWFRRCCHDCSKPRGLTPQELDEVQRVLLSSQAQWARANFPEDAGQFQSLSNPVSRIDAMLRNFINNKVENEDVFKKQEDSLLVALLNETMSRQQNVKSMMVSVAKSDVVPLLENMLSDCFNKARIQESVADWFKRASFENPGSIISLECEASDQKMEAIDPPTIGCISTTLVTSKTTNSWVILSPRENLFDCLFMNNNLAVTHMECVPLPSLPEDPSGIPCGHLLLGDSLAKDTKSAVARWSIGYSDGSFVHIEYLAQWEDHPPSSSKTLLDILRLGLATGFLKIRIPSIGAASEGDFTNQGMSLQMMDPSVAAFGASMKMFASGWSAIAGAFKTSVKEDVRLKVCLGFDEYKHTVKAMRAAGVEKGNLVEFVEHIVKTAQLPDEDDLKSIMLGVKYSDEEFTWTGEAMTFTAPDGQSHFLYFTKHADPATSKISLLYGVVSSNYKLAPDMLIVNRKRSVLGGLFESETTVFNKIPHVLTLNDTVILEMYFEMIVFRQMAIVANLTVPQYPDLSSLCDRTIG